MFVYNRNIPEVITAKQGIFYLELTKTLNIILLYKWNHKIHKAIPIKF